MHGTAAFVSYGCSPTHCWGQRDSKDSRSFSHLEASSACLSKHCQNSSRAPQQAFLSSIVGADIFATDLATHGGSPAAGPDAALPAAPRHRRKGLPERRGGRGPRAPPSPTPPGPARPGPAKVTVPEAARRFSGGPAVRLAGEPVVPPPRASRGRHGDGAPGAPQRPGWAGPFPTPPACRGFPLTGSSGVPFPACGLSVGGGRAVGLPKARWKP